MATAQTAKTQYVEAHGIRFAYRKFGKETVNGLPLFLHGHFRSNIDFWDPLLLQNLAAAREIVIFDNAGVGRSSGKVPTTFQGWADDTLAFVHALGYKKIDLLGFSMGGVAVQMVALTEPQLIRKLILAGTTSSTPGAESDVSGIVWPQEAPPKEAIAVLAAEDSETEHALAVSFFYDTEEGRSACHRYWLRVLERNVEGEATMTKLLGSEGTGRQFEAFVHWTIPNPRNAYDRLKELTMPVLVMNGDNDYLIPSSRTWELLRKIPGAQMAMYPYSGHGFLYQYSELVAHHVNLFLDGFAAVDELGAYFDESMVVFELTGSKSETEELKGEGEIRRCAVRLPH
ncbi:hypothetical protein Vi05172_g1626 [Venturia inaequalis]|nr:hypothetical protein Vi05172_g1626 [Venturia inaequalis]